jgi:hypothetical protein
MTGSRGRGRKEQRARKGWGGAGPKGPVGPGPLGAEEAGQRRVLARRVDPAPARVAAGGDSDNASGQELQCHHQCKEWGLD